MSSASSIDLTTTKKELFSSVQDDIDVLGKPHRPSIPSLVKCPHRCLYARCENASTADADVSLL